MLKTWAMSCQQQKKRKKNLRGGLEIRTRVGLCIVDRGTTLDLLEETKDYLTSC